LQIAARASEMCSSHRPPAPVAACQDAVGTRQYDCDVAEMCG
jgi:hypothetical protein